MAARYSMSAEMPPTRKSLERGRIHSHQPDQQEVPHLPERAAEKVQTYQLEAASEIPKQDSLPDLPRVDPRGYKVLQGKERFAVTPDAFLQDDTNDEGRKRSNRLAYLEGIRGICGIQTLLWIFFRLFAPAIVTDIDVDGTQPAPFVGSSPNWMNILRKVLSPLLFDGHLQGAMFVILSGRTLLHTFIERRQALALSGPAFRRPFRMLIPLITALTLVSVVNVAGGFRNATAMAASLNNRLAAPQPIWDSTLEYFNTLAAYFFSPIAYKDSRAASFIPPSGIMWFLPVVFQQTYVLIVYAWVLPYTLFKYKNLGLPLIIITTAWVGRWSWYTLTGLAIAEYSVVYLPLVPSSGIPLDRGNRRHLPVWVVPALFAFVGALLKYLWAAAFPGMYDSEFVAHANPNTGKLLWNLDASSIAYPRYDDWLLATGLLALVEVAPTAQNWLAAKPVAYLGRLSFSIALVSGTIMQSLGSYLYVYFTDHLGWTSPAQITGVLFLILVPLCLVVADLFSRLVDDGALWFSRWMFRFIRT